MPRAVLDTNVLVSALITQAGAPAMLLVEWRAGAFELLVSPTLPTELRDVLAREGFRRYVTAEEAEAYVQVIEYDAVMVGDPVSSTESVAVDPDDGVPGQPCALGAGRCARDRRRPPA